METVEKLTFFINPVAGKGNWDRAKKKIDQYCLNHNYDPEYFFTGDPGKIREVIDEREARGLRMIFAVGGDGTVNELARFMIGRKMALGILPMGSGNGLAGHLHIPSSINRSVKLIDRHEVVEMDYVMINNKPFFTTAGVGFDAEVSQKFSMAPQRGFSGYISSFFKVITSFKPSTFTIRTNGTVREFNVFVLAFANASQYGNSAFIAPEASITDGHFDMVVIQPFSFLATPFLILRLFTKTVHKSRYVETFRCTEALAEDTTNGYFHFDGEVGKHDGKIDVRVGEEKLKILVPPRFIKNSKNIKDRENSRMSIV